MSDDALTVGSVKWWLNELQDARKREKDYRKVAKRALEIYEMEETKLHPFNILRSNTELLAPALYNRLPRPEVKHRYKDEDSVAQAASKVIQRILEFLIDSNDQDFSDFDSLMKTAVEEGLIPDRGLARFQYEATIQRTPGELPEGVEVPDGEEPPMEEEVTFETVIGEEVPWDRILFGYAKVWSKLPWLAFEHFMTKAEVKDNFGEDKARAVQYSVTSKTDESTDEASQVKDAGKTRFVQVYEIWDKEKKEVIFLTSEIDEPLKKVTAPPISGFFPMPKPLQFGSRITSMIPMPIYQLYEQQAKELNRVTARIEKLIQAIRVRGCYDNQSSELASILSAGENKMIPITNMALVLDKGGLDKAIWMLPIEKWVNVLQQLYTQREQLKSVIHELTGLADIMRGSSRASETLGAQQLKAQWGGLRLRRMQREVQRFIRDCLRLKAELAVKNFSRETIQQMTDLQFPTEEQKQQATMTIAQAKQVAAATGQPPNIPPQILQMMELPTWEDIETLLKDNVRRNFNIDIETNSTVEEETVEDKQDIAEFLNAMAQFLNGLAPAMQSGLISFPVIQSMLLTVTRRFRFGRVVEEEIQKMPAPQPPQGGKEEAAKAKAAQQTLQIDQQLQQAEAKAKVEDLKRKDQIAVLEMQAKLRDLERKEVIAKAQHESKLRAIQQKNVTNGA